MLRILFAVLCPGRTSQRNQSGIAAFSLRNGHITPRSRNGKYNNIKKINLRSSCPPRRLSSSSPLALFIFCLLFFFGANPATLSFSDSSLGERVKIAPPGYATPARFGHARLIGHNVPPRRNADAISSRSRALESRQFSSSGKERNKSSLNGRGNGPAALNHAPRRVISAGQGARKSLGCSLNESRRPNRSSCVQQEMSDGLVTRRWPVSCCKQDVALRLARERDTTKLR